MRHLVTGGAGFVGSALARRLVADGQDVTVLDHFGRGKHDRVPSGAKIVMGDMRDFTDVKAACRGADRIWHLAYCQGTQTFYSNPREVIAVALDGIMNLMEACAELDSKPDFVLVSSSEAYQVPPPHMFPTDETVPLSVPDVTNPRYSYGGGKIACEIATLAFSQDGVLDRAIIVRPHNIYGPDMGHEHVIPEFIERMAKLPDDGRRHDFPIQGTGQETRSFCYIDDAVDGLLIAGEKGNDRDVFHLGNPDEEHPIERIAYMIAGRVGRKITVVPGKLPQGSPPRRKPSIAKLAKLGFEPKVPLALGIDDTVEWYVNYLAKEAAA